MCVIVLLVDMMLLSHTLTLCIFVDDVKAKQMNSSDLFCWHNTIIVEVFQLKHPINIKEALSNESVKHCGLKTNEINKIQ